MDLRAAVEADITLAAGQRAAVPTGIAVALPQGYELQIRPRSGLAIKHGITMINAPGTIDEDYRGEIAVLMINLGSEPFVVSRGMKIAQGVVARYRRVEWDPVQTLEETGRGAGGFGSTGSI